MVRTRGIKINFDFDESYRAAVLAQRLDEEELATRRAIQAVEAHERRNEGRRPQVSGQPAPCKPSGKARGRNNSSGCSTGRSAPEDSERGRPFGPQATGVVIKTTRRRSQSSSQETLKLSQQVCESLAIPSGPPCEHCGRSDVGLVRGHVWEWAAVEDAEDSCDSLECESSDDEDFEDGAVAAATAVPPPPAPRLRCSKAQLCEGALRELRSEGHTLRTLEPIDARCTEAPSAVRHAVESGVPLVLTHVDARGDGYGITQFARGWVGHDGKLNVPNFQASCGDASVPICRRGYQGNQVGSEFMPVARFVERFWTRGDPSAYMAQWQFPLDMCRRRREPAAVEAKDVVLKQAAGGPPGAKRDRETVLDSELPHPKRNRTSSGQHRKSRFRGVTGTLRGSAEGGRIRWAARLKQENLGVFDTEREAALAYDNRARVVFGERAILNFPDDASDGSSEEDGGSREEAHKEMRADRWALRPNPARAAAAAAAKAELQQVPPKRCSEDSVAAGSRGSKVTGDTNWSLASLSPRLFGLDFLREWKEEDGTRCVNPLQYLFMGTSATYSKLHRDPGGMTILIAPIVGQKEVLLVHRDETDKLRDLDELQRDVFTSTDIDAHPLLLLARSWKVVLHPGDVLVMPPGTYHAVRNVTSCLSYSRCLFGPNELPFMFASYARRDATELDHRAIVWNAAYDVMDELAHDSTLATLQEDKASNSLTKKDALSPHAEALVALRAIARMFERHCCMYSAAAANAQDTSRAGTSSVAGSVGSSDVSVAVAINDDHKTWEWGVLITDLTIALHRLGFPVQDDAAVRNRLGVNPGKGDRILQTQDTETGSPKSNVAFSLKGGLGGTNGLSDGVRKEHNSDPASKWHRRRSKRVASTRGEPTVSEVRVMRGDVVVVSPAVQCDERKGRNAVVLGLMSGKEMAMVRYVGWDKQYAELLPLDELRPCEVTSSATKPSSTTTEKKGGSLGSRRRIAMGDLVNVSWGGGGFMRELFLGQVLRIIRTDVLYVSYHALGPEWNQYLRPGDVVNILRADE